MRIRQAKLVLRKLGERKQKMEGVLSRCRAEHFSNRTLHRVETTRVELIKAQTRFECALPPSPSPQPPAPAPASARALCALALAVRTYTRALFAGCDASGFWINV